MSTSVDLLIRSARKDIHRHIDFNSETGAQSLDWSAHFRSYRKHLLRLERAVGMADAKMVSAARTRFFKSFSCRLLGMVRALRHIEKTISSSAIEGWVEDLSLYNTYNELVTLRPERSKEGKFRIIGLTGTKRKAQQFLIRDALQVLCGDSPFDATASGAGGEKAFFRELKCTVAKGYPNWVTFDVRDFFPSLRAAHVKGLPLPMWMIEHFLFLPKTAPICFVDPIHGLNISEEAINQADESVLPQGYPIPMVTLKSKLSKVRQGLIQGDVSSPYVARAFLRREVQQVLTEDAVCGSYLDNLMLGAPTYAGVKTFYQALSNRLISHPAGPLELHGDNFFDLDVTDGYFLGYRIGYRGDQLNVRPGIQRFDGFRKKLTWRLKGSDAFTKEGLVHYGLTYAKAWFAAQSGWDKNDESWTYVVAEVHACVNQLIQEELVKGIGYWTDDDIDPAIIAT